MLRKLLYFTTIFVFACSLNAETSWLGESASEPVKTSVLAENGSHTDILVEFSGIIHKLNDDGENLFSLDGKNFTEIPNFTKMAVVPAYKKVSVKVLSLEYIEVDFIGALPDIEEVASVGRPVIMRDLRLVPLTVYPLKRSEKSGKALLLKNIRVSLEYSGYSDVNNKVFERPTSEAFQELYRKSVINYSELDDPTYGVGKGTYLIIISDTNAEVSAFQNFVEWKEMKGYQVEIHTTNVTLQKEDIQAIIDDAYANSDPPLEYVLLVGDANQGIVNLMYYTVVKPGGGETDPTDHDYTLLEGDDYFSDILIGRISVANTTHVQIIFNKILNYEKSPFMIQTDWFQRMLSVAGNYNDSGDYPITPVQTGWWIADYFLSHGFTQADTIFNWVPGEPPYTGEAEILNSMNAGKGFVTYRGWAAAYGWQWPVFNIGSLPFLTNGWKLFICGSFVCQTGNYGGNCLGEEILRTGTPNSGNGAVAFYGPSDLHTNTNYNNSVSTGFCEGFLELGMSSFGAAAFHSKQSVYEGFPLERDEEHLVPFYFRVYNCLGDPEMWMWRAIPLTLTMDCPSSVPQGTASIDVTVTRNGSPVNNAYVTVIADGELVEGRYTNASGEAVLTFDPNISGLKVCATKANYLPAIQNVSFTTANYVGYESSQLVNESDPDGYLNPGETADIRITVKNFGSTAQNNVQGAISSANPYVTLSNPDINFGNLAGNATATQDVPVQIANIAPSMSAVDFDLDLTTSVGSYSSKFSLLLDGSSMIISSYSIVGGIINAGEEGDIQITLQNTGAFDAEGVSVQLSSFDEAVNIIDGTASFGDIASGASAANSDPLTIRIESGAFEGRMIQLRLKINPDVGSEQMRAFDIVVGTPGEDDPTGPDPYGYFAYDDADVDYESVPVYDWVELDPAYPGAVFGATQTFMYDDESMLVPLPFDFLYYGDTYDELTICTNGWVSMTETWQSIFRNWDLPSPQGPPALIAPFWDDLKDTVDSLLDIYYWHDTQNDRFIVEWSRVHNRYVNTPDRIETFEVILYNSQSSHVGPTGDSDILFQYHHVVDVDLDNNYSTVGIEDYQHSRGLEYVYADEYESHPTATPLHPEMAILITTTPPDGFLSAGDDPNYIPKKYSLNQNYPNPFNPETIIDFELAESNYTELSVFNVNGRLVRTLISDDLSAGKHSEKWNGADNYGNSVPSGMYFIRLNSGDYSRTIKSILMK